MLEMFESIDNHTITAFIKETHFTINCKLCYFILYQLYNLGFTFSFYPLLIVTLTTTQLT